MTNNHKKKNEIFFSLLLTIFSLALVVGLFEAVLRTAIFSDVLSIPTLKQPWRYADSGLDDDYWKLQHIFHMESTSPAAGFVDQELGWSPRKDAGNPLGIHRIGQYNINDFKNPIMFYGDSFVAGVTKPKTRIPHYLEKNIGNREVLNFGVSGYGVDQIYLRFSKTVGLFSEPIVLVGLLTDDVNRTILRIRTHQKPIYELNDNNLVLRNLPIQASTSDYITLNPPQINSYFMRFVLFRLRQYLPVDWFDGFMGYSQKQQYKTRLNTRLIQAFKEESNKRNIKPYFVLFYSGDEFATPIWEEKFLKSILASNGLDYFDTKDYLNIYMKKHNISLENIYLPDNGHPNARGNKIIADGLHNWLLDKHAI